MSLSVEARHCGLVYVIRCHGRIVAGEELAVLESAIKRAMPEFPRVVLQLGEVTRVDSTGIGLLVRYLAHTRNRSGDLRLADTPPYLAELLRLTKLANVFSVYPSEEQAIVSFLKQPAASDPDEKPVGPLVLFVDRSPDLCAFVRALLRNHGYAVLSTCLVNDAKLLILGTTFDYVVLGPDTSPASSDKAAEVLRPLAHSAQLVQLPGDFKYDDPERAGAQLLRMMERAAPASA